MGDIINFTIDSIGVEGKPGQTIMEAADNAGIYIPRLCNLKELEPFGGCRVCTVMVNGRPQSACTQPISEGIIVDNDTEELLDLRRDLIDMLFIEGNHYCMFCEKSGNCELQALAYLFGISAPKYPYMFNKKELDPSHPDIFIDRNRCILCARCVRASKTEDGKHVFDFTNRGKDKKISVNSFTDLSGTDAKVTDKSIESCPVGCLIKKRVGFKIPIGERLYDQAPIGTDIEENN